MAAFIGPFKEPISFRSCSHPFQHFKHPYYNVIFWKKISLKETFLLSNTHTKFIATKIHSRDLVNLRYSEVKFPYVLAIVTFYRKISEK